MHLLKRPSPPLQSAIRAGVAISIAIAITQWFHVALGYWLILSTVVVLQPTFGATLQRSKARALGTLLGVAMGALLAALLNHSLIPTAIIAFILILCCIISIKVAQAGSIFFATTLVMLLLSYNNPNHWEFITTRVYDTIIGACIGIGSSLLLWPSWAKSELNDHLILTIERSQRLLDLIINAIITKNDSLDIINPLKLELESMIDKNREFLKQSTHELTSSSRQLAPSFALLDNLDQMHMVLRTLHFISTADFKASHPRKLHQSLQNLKHNVNAALAYTHAILSEQSDPYNKAERQLVFDNIKVLSELPQDRTPALRFLHRHMNLLLVECNHIVHAALLMNRP